MIRVEDRTDENRRTENPWRTMSDVDKAALMGMFRKDAKMVDPGVPSEVVEAAVKLYLLRVEKNAAAPEDRAPFAARRQSYIRSLPLEVWDRAEVLVRAVVMVWERRAANVPKGQGSA